MVSASHYSEQIMDCKDESDNKGSQINLLDVRNMSSEYSRNSCSFHCFFSWTSYCFQYVIHFHSEKEASSRYLLSYPVVYTMKKKSKKALAHP